MAYSFEILKTEGNIPGLMHVYTDRPRFPWGKKMRVFSNNRSYDTIVQLRKDVARILKSNNLLSPRISTGLSNVAIVYRGQREFATMRYSKTIYGMQIIWKAVGVDMTFYVKPSGELDRSLL